MSVKIYYDHVKYRINKTREIKRFLEKVIRDENRNPGDLVFILTSDGTILDINRKFLKHDYCTDVISFSYSAENIVSGEIYISVDTIRKNAVKYKVGITEEILRVMIHGVLHLCGYEDENERERVRMFKRQEEKLKEFKEGPE